MDETAAVAAQDVPPDERDSPYYWLGRLSTSLVELLNAEPGTVEVARASIARVTLREYDQWLAHHARKSRADELHIQGELDAYGGR